MIGEQLLSSAGIWEGWIVIISVKGGGLDGCDSVESSSTDWAPDWESERLLKSGEADAECGCGSGEKFGRGGRGRPAPVSEKEAAAMAVKGTGAITVSARTALQDRAFGVAAEEGREQGFNFVCEGKSSVALLAGWMTSTSSRSELSCSDRGQNGSSTCRNTRVIILRTRYGGQTQSPIQRPWTSRKSREEKTSNTESSPARPEPPRDVRHMQSHTVTWLSVARFWSQDMRTQPRQKVSRAWRLEYKQGTLICKDGMHVQKQIRNDEIFNFKDQSRPSVVQEPWSWHKTASLINTANIETVWWIFTQKFTYALLLLKCLTS